MALDGILTLESNTKNVLKKRSNCVKWKIMEVKETKVLEPTSITLNDVIDFLQSIKMKIL
ncbi:hypothetical protein ACT7DA_23560 [Bacillus pacificus]